MPLTDDEITSIADRVSERIENTCQCGLSADARNEVSHFFGMVKDIGGGRYSDGVEVMRDIGKRYKRLTKISERLSSGIMYLLMAAMFGGALYLLKKGAIALIKSLR